MQFRDFLKFNKRIKELPQYTRKEDLPRATKAMKERNLKDFFSREKHPKEKEKMSYDDKVNRGLERAYERKDKKALGSWLRAWAKEDRKDLRRLERDLMRE